MSDLTHAFLDHSRHYLAVEYPAKIDRCLDGLTEADVWWRPNDASNSIGNLLLHLSGNVRQWIVHGIGEAADTRERAGEFAAEGTLPKADLQHRLHATLDEADAVLSRLTDADLLEPRTVQGLETTVLGAVYHVVEHFSMHTGQILYITKLCTGTDLGFYQEQPDGTIHVTWPGGELSR